MATGAKEAANANPNAAQLLKQALTANTKKEGNADSIAAGAKKEESSKSAGESRDKNKCIICLDREKVFACIPCGHLVLCDMCSSMRGLNSCPLCRVPISSLIKIYL